MLDDKQVAPDAIAERVDAIIEEKLDRMEAVLARADNNISVANDRLVRILERLDRAEPLLGLAESWARLRGQGKPGFLRRG